MGSYTFEGVFVVLRTDNDKYNKLKIDLKAILSWIKSLYDSNSFFTIKDLIRHKSCPLKHDSQIHSLIRRLIREGFLERKIFFNDKELKELVINQHNNYLKDSLKICEWCDNKVIALHEHHYPISRKNGGENIVNICPNCHNSFHFLKQESLIKLK